MKSIVSKIMKWLGENLEGVIALCVLAISQLASYLKLKHDVAAHDKKIDQNEKVIDDHVSSPILHRTPDFEKTQSDIKAEIVRVNAKLDRVLELLPRRP